ncbi:hypothetical protein TetV_527 [Tetraselmis virus 1]|uniref:Uncharacterized protein n=1 Tax=Tetraselmis virus 1 TaxID=2060617 RepID=A0A2P0VPA6_9VIRU|nr:hypothetical protein QJ968_gp527 [Tetraselmis virus 1]AUF82609.1 hypothetical protein TetV_527 [Tetraselmis virus 1]
MGFFSSKKKNNKPSSSLPNKIKHDNLSFEAIDDIVDDFMKDKAINQSWIPDVIEQTLYKNMLRLVLGLMARIVDGVSISFMGHKIVMDMTPNTEELVDVEAQVRP